ncbi:MAG: metalloregulator ArsR/SmtB family transcription factor [Meiothermus sp.]|nr:metalloregulator ArsR/SmtB family transcription factor [Meiothermus sp.]
MVEVTELEQQLEGFKALSDPTRLGILRLLEGGTRCVCQIQAVLPEIAPNLLSHHLRVLREAGLVRAVKRGRWIDYSLNGVALEQLCQAIPQPQAHSTLCTCEAL